MFQDANPKCANPACQTPFEWRAGGKYFRFRPQELPGGDEGGLQQPENLHGVNHYWLCERCAGIYTLVYSGEYGVLVRPLWPEFVSSEKRNELIAT